MRHIFKALILSSSIVAVSSVAMAETNLEFWQFWTDPDVKPVITEIVQQFEQQNPGTKVNVTDLTWANGHEKVVVAFASGTGPDVVELGSDWVAQFAESGHLENIGDQLSADSSGFYGWSMSTYKGGVYGWPWILGTRVLFGNTKLNQRVGIDSGLVPTSWAHLESACRMISGLGGGVYGWGSNTAEKHRLYKKFLPFLWGNGAQLFTDDGRYCSLASLKSIEALKFYRRLHDSTGYVADQRGIEDAFLEGKIGYIISGDWLLRRIQKEKPPLAFVTTFIPGSKFSGRSFMGGEFLCVNAKSPNADVALRFIRFLTSPENQVKLCKAGYMANPSSLEAQKDSFFASDPNLETFIKQIRFAKHPPVHPDWVDMEAAIEEAVEKGIFGPDTLVAHSLYEASRKIQDILDR